MSDDAPPAFNAVCGEVWAITHEWLHVIAALALRDRAGAAAMATQIRGHSDDDRPPPTPAERFNASVYVAQRKRVRPLEGQGSGRAVVIDNVAVLPILGPIFPRANMMTEMSGATSCTTAMRDLQAALDAEDVHAVVASIDSPGGAVTGINNFADMIYGARNQKPMCAHVSGLGCSAAYWLASSFERVALDKTALVGSIGVVQAIPKQVSPGSSGQMIVEIVSSNAPNKRPDPLSGDGVLTIRESLDAIEATFLADVARGRNTNIETVLAKFGQGGVVVGKEAVSRGMADGVETLDASIARMGRIAKTRGSRPA